jgi:hypothetical protein
MNKKPQKPTKEKKPEKVVRAKRIATKQAKVRSKNHEWEK